MFLFLIKFSF